MFRNYIIMSAVLLAAALSLPADALCGTYTVMLNNGNTLTANSYKISGEMLELNFPLGEAAFRLSEVTSITDDGGQVVLFQEKGDYIPTISEKPVKTGDDADYADTGTFAQPGAAGGASYSVADTGGMPAGNGSSTVHRQWVQAYYSPQVEEIDKFIDEMFKADEEGRELSEDEVDRAFAAFFDDGTGGSSADSW